MKETSLSGSITHSNILRVLVAGFALVILLLVAAGFVGVRNIERIKENAARLVREQSVTNGLIDEIQRQQASLSEVFSVLARDPDSVDADSILAQLDMTEGNIDRIAQAGEQTPQQHLWVRLKEASRAFSLEARRLLSVEEPETFASRDLFHRHEQVISVMARLVEASYRRAIAAQNQINERSQGLMRESVILLSLCLTLALVTTALTVRLTTQLIHKMEWQTGELSRVSWHMLENQESAARRFSHELHDELGQSLTAVKANLLALGSQPAVDRQRLDDCLHLVDESIGNVRQMSQLLRPTILDDFGLEAGLRWLCEGFTHRTGIEVEFTSNLTGRLPDETETHLFRIAQEALTNIARHSGARKAAVDLALSGEEIVLFIRDEGHGLVATRSDGMGMIGMRARARSAGGDLSLRSRQGQGVTIEVRVPAGGSRNERKDPHPVG